MAEVATASVAGSVTRRMWECPICFEEFDVAMMLVDCGHMLCEKCITNAYRACYTCGKPVANPPLRCYP